MSSDGFIDPADLLAEECEREHDRPDADCVNCQIRAEIVHCGQCSADFVDGKWWNVRLTPSTPITGPNGCDHESLTDDWGNEVRCTTLAGPRSNLRRCGDGVTTPGQTACEFHRRWLEADECNRAYQRLVAVR